MPEPEITFAAVRDKLITLFESTRSMPGAEYDKEHFLDFLIPNPSGTHSIHDSCRGRRLFWKFIDTVQVEFAVCFSTKKDLDCRKQLSIDGLATRILELQNAPQTSLTALDRRQQTAISPQGGILLFNLPIGLLLLVFWSHVALRCVGFVLLVLVNCGILIVLGLEYIYCRRLRTLIGNRPTTA
jgi:hypothetical protein